MPSPDLEVVALIPDLADRNRSGSSKHLQPRGRARRRRYPPGQTSEVRIAEAASLVASERDPPDQDAGNRRGHHRCHVGGNLCCFLVENALDTIATTLCWGLLLACGLLYLRGLLVVPSGAVHG